MASHLSHVACVISDPQIDVVRALAEGIRRVQNGQHDPQAAHSRIKAFYDWALVTERTDAVYDAVLASPERTLWERLKRSRRLGTFAGLIYCCIMIVDCLFFAVLEWMIPRQDIDYVEVDWDLKKAAAVRMAGDCSLCM